MPGICLTAGPSLADVLWCANVLPYLRRALPHAHLAWECPTQENWPWLRLYPELDEVVGDVEEMPIAPEHYLILHPLWQNRDAPVAGLFELIGGWCPPPEDLPSLPYCPPAAGELPHLSDLPEAYLCVDPNLQPSETASEGLIHEMEAALAVLPLPAVQLGARACPLLPFAIDARGCGALAMAHLIRHAKLCIGGDGDASVMAGALQRPQIWIVPAGNSWRWPRSQPPACVCHEIESLAYLDTPALSALARTALGQKDPRP